MQRVPEPELMTGLEQARAYAEADFDGPNGAFVDALHARLGPLADQARVLDLGCGPGDILVRLAQAHPGWSLVGVDGSQAMLAFARAAAGRARCERQITHVCSRVPDGEGLPAGPFELVISNSLLHHLHQPAGLWQTIAQVSAPGTAVMVMDLCRPISDAAVHALVVEYAAGEPEVLQRDFLNSLKAAFTVDEVRAQLDAAGLPELEIATTSDRHMLIWGRRAG